MIKFWNRTIRVNEMAGKFYVEIKNKAFETDSPAATVDSAEVKVFDTTEEVEEFLSEALPG